MGKINLDIPHLVGDKKPTVMINFLSDKHFDKEWVKDVKSLWDLELLILELVDNCNEVPSDENLLKIFHLIEIWGGYSGRSVYLDYEDGFDWEVIKVDYKKIVKDCLEMDRDINNDKSIEIVYKSMINNKIKHIGVSFATKHIRFWTYKKLRENMLPIYDSIMAKYYKEKSKGKSDVFEYWKWMIDNRKDKSLARMEREIYNDLKNNNL